MTTSALASIETALDVVLPGPYRAAMLTYPLDPADANSQIALQNTASAVIAFNRFLREEFGGEWRQDSFAIGNSPCGDPYFLDLGSSSPAVWSWNHETHEVAQEAPDFSSWLAVQKALEAGDN